MSENIKFNKGDSDSAYVIPEEIIDLGEAEITHKGDKNQDWYDYQVQGRSDKEERELVSNPNTDPKKVAEALKRAKQMRIGQSIIGVLNMLA